MMRERAGDVDVKPVIGRLDDDSQVRDDVIDRMGMTGDTKKYGPTTQKTR